jgi:putative N6-adenine-specific DNA methylase/tRNA (guanine6-N2)-methyltransferase
MRDSHLCLHRAGLTLSLGVRRPYELSGQIIVTDGTGTPEQVVAALSESRSLYHVILHLAAFRMRWPEAQDHDDGSGHLEALLGRLRRVEIPEMEHAQSFRVTCNRSGTHAFGSMDVERAFGAQLVERFGTRVSLEHFDTHVRVDVVDTLVLLGIQLTTESLDKRYHWVFRPRVTLRTVLAYGMLQLAELDRTPQRILDPFCGSGTILFEAASIFPEAEILGCDHREEAVEGTQANIRQLAQAEDTSRASRIEVRQADARDLEMHYEPASIDLIVTNPPYGIRLHQHVDFRALYGKFFHGATRILKPGGRIVMLVGKRMAAFNQALRQNPSLRVRHVRVVEIGGVYPRLFVLERQG